MNDPNPRKPEQDDSEPDPEGSEPPPLEDIPPGGGGDEIGEERVPEKMRTSP
ncbi:hypothetical protein [Brevundimonas faecalis]|uniref:Uncharacterized protein n=1 Tax=Brevundimonas faecalis TaxID=947378 RepID=A0ABV2R7R7_9CAUL